MKGDLLGSLSNGDIFTSEDNMLFSHVKTSCFRAKAHLVFHRCLYNKDILYTLCFLSRNCIFTPILIHHDGYKVMMLLQRMITKKEEKWDAEGPGTYFTSASSALQQGDQKCDQL